MASNSSTNPASSSSSGVDAKTPSGQMSGFGWDQLGQISEKWGDNESMAGIIIGAMVDGAITNINAGANLQFESSMAELQNQLQMSMAELKSEMVTLRCVLLFPMIPSGVQEQEERGL